MTTQHRRRRAAALGLLAALAVPAVAAAGSGTQTPTGPTGAKYRLTTTCATRSATMSVDLRSAGAGFERAELTDASGALLGHLQYGVNGVPSATTGPIQLQGSTYVQDEDGFAVREVKGGTATAIAGPVSMLDCPTYASAGAAFAPLTPTRILDTRVQLGYSGAKPGSNTIVDMQVTGVAGVPTNAVAAVLNVTMTDTTSGGFLQAFPTGQGTAGASSNVNADAAGQSIPNSVIVPIGVGGKVSLYTSHGTHILADIAGYFVNAPSSGAAAGRYAGITPKRVLDTRSGAKPAGSSVRINPVVAAALPVGKVAAVAVNITATESDAPGFVQVAAAGTLVPGASSTVNLVRQGQTIANMAIVPVSASGELELYTLNGTHLIVDVLGYFTNASAPTSVSGLYVPMTPERVLDSRPDSAVNYDATRSEGKENLPGVDSGDVFVYFQGLPIGLGPVVLNLTATGATAPGFVQGDAQGALVIGASSNINIERPGHTASNAAILPTSAGGIQLHASNSTHLVADISGFFRR